MNTYEANAVKDLAELAMREHYASGEYRGAYCPKSPRYPDYSYDAGWACDCGADEHNAKVVALYKGLVGDASEFTEIGECEEFVSGTP